MAGTFQPTSPEALKGANIRDIQVFNPVDIVGEEFSGTFRNYAIGNDRSYILIHFEKGKPSEAWMDYTNCTNDEIYAALKECLGDK